MQTPSGNSSSEATPVESGDRRVPTLSLTAYPWDFADGGLADQLDRLRGEVGLTGFSVWAATPGVKQFRVRDVQPRVFRTDGGVFFQPSANHGFGRGCRPLVSTWTRGGNPLATIAEQCVRSELRLRAILPAATTGQLALRSPEFACRNAFDDESESAVCLANPDVQESLLSLASDITGNYPVQGLILTDFAVSWRDAFFAELLLPSPLGEAERRMLSTCFCAHCVRVSESAGIDVQEARRRVRTIIEKALCESVPLGKTFDALLADQPAIAEHRRVQTERLNALLRGLVGTCRAEVLLARATDDLSSAWPAGLDHRIPAAVLSRAESIDRLGEALIAGARRNELWVPASWTVGSRAAEFIGAMPRAVQMGFAGIDIDNYALLPETAFTTVRQAIRFARRSVGA